MNNDHVCHKKGERMQHHADMDLLAIVFLIIIVILAIMAGIGIYLLIKI